MVMDNEEYVKIKCNNDDDSGDKEEKDSNKMYHQNGGGSPYNITKTVLLEMCCKIFDK